MTFRSYYDVEPPKLVYDTLMVQNDSAAILQFLWKSAKQLFKPTALAG
jgi:hypothetical protein